MIKEQILNRIIDAIQAKQSSALDPDMKPFRIEVRAMETWETYDGNQRSANAKFEQTIMANSFQAAIKYVQETFNSENVTITSLKIKDIS